LPEVEPEPEVPLVPELEDPLVPLVVPEVVGAPGWDGSYAGVVGAVT
jgi:hypothetical protein